MSDGNAPRKVSTKKHADVRRSYYVSVGLVLLTAFIVYLAGNASIPLWDRDEPRYTTASREMVENSDWVKPTFLGEPRLNKPIFIYWVQKLSMDEFGTTPWAARFPSSLAMLFTLAMLAYVMPKIVGKRRAFWTVFILASSAIVIASAKIALTDAVLLLFITTAQLCLYAMWRGKGTWLVTAIFGVAVGLALLTKGPVVLGISGTTIAMLALFHWVTPRKTGTVQTTQNVETFFLSMAGKVVLVLAIIAAVALPWVLAIEKREPGWLLSTIGGEVVNRGKSAMEGHTGPPGYYVLLVWATFFPWSIFLIAAIVWGIKLRTHPFTRFALAAVIGPWIMLEIYATKLPHYLLPAYPFMAFLVANVIQLARRKLIPDLGDKPYLIGVSIAAGLVTLVSLGLLLVPALSDSEGAKHYFAMIALITFIIGSAWYTVFKLSEKRIVLAAAFMGTAMLLGAFIFGFMYMPHTNAFNVSQRVAQILETHGGTGPASKGQVKMVGYKEPSLGFYQGGTIREEDRDDVLLQEPRDNWPTFLVYETAMWEKLYTPDIRKQYDVIGRVRGLSVAEGPRVDVTVLKRVQNSVPSVKIETPVTTD
jgi:4-amino-4-deoxy-L-arabinose transferase-like glycosyltransferase